MKKLTMLMMATLLVGVCSVAKPAPVNNIVHISGLDKLQKIHDYKAHGNTVVILGNKYTCPHCVTVERNIGKINKEFPNVTIVFVNSTHYSSLVVGRSIPELQFYKDGVLVQRTVGAKSVAQLRNLLNKHYR